MRASHQRDSYSDYRPKPPVNPRSGDAPRREYIDGETAASAPDERLMIVILRRGNAAIDGRVAFTPTVRIS